MDQVYTSTPVPQRNKCCLFREDFTKLHVWQFNVHTLSSMAVLQLCQLLVKSVLK